MQVGAQDLSPDHLIDLVVRALRQQRAHSNAARRLVSMNSVYDLGLFRSLSDLMSRPSIVFVAGSRHISRLPAEVRSRLDTMIEKGFQILVGDANGADKAVQRYLADKSYPNVVVHCMKDHCRNNVGRWPIRQLVAPRGAKGFDYYSVKDCAMAEAAEYGLMLWDGKSKGTVNNVVNLSRGQKPVVVYFAPTRRFRTIKSFDDLKDLLAKGDSDSVQRIVSDLRLNGIPRRAAG